MMNEGELDSFLIEITSKIFRRLDEESGIAWWTRCLTRHNRRARENGPSQNAMDVGAPIPTINSAVTGRIISSLKEERVAASAQLPGPETQSYEGGPPGVDRRHP